MSIQASPGRRFRPLLLVVATVVGVLVGGTVAWLGFAPVALATTSNCNRADGYLAKYHTSATNSNGLSFNSYGIKASTGDLVYGAPGTECLRVASVWAQDGLGDFAEVGWHTENGDMTATHCPPAQSPTHPMAFDSYSTINSWVCSEYGNTSTVSAGTYYPVSVRSLSVNNPCTSTQYQIIFDGVDLNNPDVGFCVGASVTNAERVRVEPSNVTQEPVDAHFKGMKYWNPGTTAWTDWASHKCFWGLSGNAPSYQDPAYVDYFPSDSNTEVQVTDLPLTGGLCPNGPAP